MDTNKKRKRSQELEKFSEYYGNKLIHQKQKKPVNSSDSQFSIISLIENEELNTSAIKFNESVEEIEFDCTMSQEINEIRAWIIDNNISHVHVDKLLLILKQRLLPEIPINAKSLLKSSPGIVKLENMDETNRLIEKSIYYDAENIENKEVNLKEHSENVQSSTHSITNRNFGCSVYDEDPMNEMDPVECKSEFEVFVVQMLRRLKKDISQFQESQEKFQNFLLDKMITTEEESIDFTKKYNYNFPLATLEAFLTFDKELKTNTLLKKDVILQISDLFDNNYIITRNFTKMLKFFLKKQVAEQFTAIRFSKTQNDSKKLKFVSTTLYALMCGVIKIKRNKKKLETTDKMLKKGISDILSNVKTWT